MAYRSERAAPQRANVASVEQIGGGQPIKSSADLNHLDKVTPSSNAPMVPAYVPLSDQEKLDLAQEMGGVPGVVPANPANIPANSPSPVQDPEPPVTPNPDEINDPRFKGKTAKEIYESLRNLESDHGRLANEVGQYRKMFSATNPQQPQSTSTQSQPNPVNEADLVAKFLTKPSEVMNQIKADIRAELNANAQRSRLEALASENSTLLQDQKFLGWVKQTVPVSLIMEADRDPDKFQFLVNQYRATGALTPAPQPISPVVPPPVSPQPPVSRTVAVPSVAATGTGASGKAPGPKIWSRKVILNMHLNNPQEYARNVNEIQAAYNEGRVRE